MSRPGVVRYGPASLGLLTCCDCGRPMAKVKLSKPQGEAICQGCRRARWPAAGPCPICGVTFQPKRDGGSGWTTSCGRACSGVLRRRNNGSGTELSAPAHRRAMFAAKCARRQGLMASAFVELVDPVAVCERDGWACHLCGDDVEQGLRSRHRWSASMDHVVPLVRGGDHSYANVRLAHFRCNSAKGARV